MAQLHLDAFSGVAGDMLLSALCDAGASLDPLREVLSRLQLPVTVSTEEVMHCGIRALHLEVTAPDDQPTRHLPEIREMIDGSGMPARACQRALAAFDALAGAEAEIHGMSVDKVHFHEVGALDSITDILGSALALDLLDVDSISSRSIPLGSGTVTCEHGRMPVPAPATALLMRGMPIAKAPVTGELTTPTGAAMIKAWVNEWTEQPNSYTAVGTGAGTRRYLEHPNLLRVFLNKNSPAPRQAERICRLETWVDDIGGDALGYLLEQALAAGALDTALFPMTMKKSRPGHAVVVLCRPEKSSLLAELIFRETGSLGIRHEIIERWVLPRRESLATTPWGAVRVKWAHVAPGDERPDPEHDDCATLAQRHGVALSIIRNAALASAQATR